MAPISDPKIRALGDRILKYLDEHPEAADNIHGIVSWWLPPGDPPGTAADVQEALALLVAERRIALLHLADGRTLYQGVHKPFGPPPNSPPSKPKRRP